MADFAALSGWDLKDVYPAAAVGPQTFTAKRMEDLLFKPVKLPSGKRRSKSSHRNKEQDHEAQQPRAKKQKIFEAPANQQHKHGLRMDDMAAPDMAMQPANSHDAVHGEKKNKKKMKKAKHDRHVHAMRIDKKHPAHEMQYDGLPSAQEQQQQQQQEQQQQRQRKSKNKFKQNLGQTATAPVHTDLPTQPKHQQEIMTTSSSKPQHRSSTDDALQGEQQQPHVEQPSAKPMTTPGGQKSTPKAAAAAAATASPAANLSATAKKKNSLLDKMRAQLQGGHFRYLNEALYTHSGKDALAMMQQDPSLFEQYHAGFQQQTKYWPKQPVDMAIAWLSKQPAEWHVADFGCGDARLASSVQQTVHSFDLVASAPQVVACNMAHVPLGPASVNVAVFSLALMGTDYGSFLVEACRVLRSQGWLWIAEVRSRFADDNDRDDLHPFLKCLKQLGFKLVSKDTSNKMFVILVLQKIKDGKEGNIQWPELKPCVYKRR